MILLFIRNFFNFRQILADDLKVHAQKTVFAAIIYIKLI